MKLRLATATASSSDGSAALDSGTSVDRSGRIAHRLVLLAWLVILVLLLRHREIISSDTLSNYVHVWFVSEQLWHGHGLPFHMPVLANGAALAFPYAFIPWMFAVLLWPLMGEWSVTLVLGIGFVGLVAATFWAFPELRRGWWAAAALVNPALFEGVLLGQLPFLWGAAMLMAAIAAWRRGRRTTAVVLAALAQITHAPVLLPLVALVVAARYPYEPDRRALVRGWLLSLVPAIPAAALVFASPVASQNSLLYTMWIELETVTLRSLVLAIPFTLLLIQRRGWRRSAPALAAGAMVIGQLITIPISGMGVGWSALVRRPDPSMSALPASTDFVRGATYRVLTFGDGKYGQYSVVRAGGRLDSEFFPESLYRRSFPDEAHYARFLTRRHVDFVVVGVEYHRFHTNEQQLLTAMAAKGASCVNGVAVHLVDDTATYQLYKVDRKCGAA